MEKTIDYQKQAQDFLDTVGAIFKIEYAEHGAYWPDDKETRDIYRFTLKKGKHSYSAKFGQSIVGTNEGKEPTAYDVLACLTKSDPGTFEQFCGDFGYDTDSRKAEKTYKAVKREWAGLSRVFTESELVMMQEIA